MANFDLRPLSLGELLDRTISLYRSNFVLFAGISAVPHLFTLAWHLEQMLFVSVPAIRARATGIPPQPGAAFESAARDLLAFVIEAFIIYLITQSATAYAVSELYLGRKSSIADAFRQVVRRIWNLAAVTLLAGAPILAGLVTLFIPGISLACRLMTALPAAVVENLGPRQAFKRSFVLTRDNVRRALGIYFLYFVLRVTAYLLIVYPYSLARETFIRHSGTVPVWLAFATVGSVGEATLIGPFLTIAATVFYFDLRVRKEALDLQMMMSSGERIPAGPLRAPSV